MINPTQFNTYQDYTAFCKAENEIAASIETWAKWKYPDQVTTEKTLEQRVANLEAIVRDWTAGK